MAQSEMPMSVLLSAVPIFLFGTGIFYMLRLRGFCWLHPLRCLRALRTRPSAGGISPARALTVALAGTLGVGNIVGVASALWLGGPGAVFWMPVSALVAMILKYAEITLAMRHRRTLPQQTGEASPAYVGGAPYYIADSLSARGAPRMGRVAAVVFALLCLANALTMGGILQINAVAGAMKNAFSVPPLAVGIAVAVLAVVAVRGGARRISALTERLVPLMTVGFLAACLAVIWLRRERVDDAWAAVWRDVCTPEGVGGGLFGFFLSRGVRYGVMRGLVSNEAGCGTAPMAHVAADTDSPATQGLFGIIEVFVDTVLLCTVTALAILVSDSGYEAYGDDAVRTAQAAFSSVLGHGADAFFAISILCFGVATVLCWAHYGVSAVGYLSAHPAAKTAFTVIYAVSLILGAVTAPALAWDLADAAIGLMTLLNLAVLLLSHREVAEETERLFPRKKHCTADPKHAPPRSISHKMEEIRPKERNLP